MRNKFLSFVLMIAGLVATGVTTLHPEWLGISAPTGVSMALVVNAANLTALFKNFKTIFNEAVTAYKPMWQDGAMRIDSTTSVENYSWMEAFPKMREWIGDRFIKNLSTQAYDVANKNFEDTVAVPRTKIEDDQIGIFRPIVAAQGAAAAQLWDDLFFALMNNSFTGKSYDGIAFFATTHKSGSNKLSGGGSVLSATSWETALAQIKSTKDAQGNPMFSGNETLTLWVPPALEGVARKIINADFISVTGGSTETNVWKGSANLKACPKLTSATAWFVTVNFNGLQPFVVQVRQEAEFDQLVDPSTSDHVFKRNEYLYGTYARGNAAYGLHQLALGSVGA
jgi:phage major head subunit gpT-like protein